MSADFLPSFKAGLAANASPCAWPLALGLGVSLLAVSFHRMRTRQTLSVASLIVGFMGGFMVRGLDLFQGDLKKILGVGVLAFGLFLAVDHLQQIRPTARKLSIFVLGCGLSGATLAWVWIPCAGPSLGAGLRLAADPSTCVSGAIQLLLYALGVGFPFLVVGISLQGVTSWIMTQTKHGPAIGFVFSLCLATIGGLIFNGQFMALFRLYPQALGTMSSTEALWR